MKNININLKMNVKVSTEPVDIEKMLTEAFTNCVSTDWEKSNKMKSAAMELDKETLKSVLKKVISTSMMGIEDLDKKEIDRTKLCNIIIEDLSDLMDELESIYFREARILTERNGNSPV